MPRSRLKTPDRALRAATASAIGKRLRGLREERSRREARIVSQGEVGAAIGVDGPRINTYERGKKVPGAPILAQLAAYYGVTLDYLITGALAPRAAKGKGKKDDAELEALLARVRALSPETRAVVRDFVAVVERQATATIGAKGAKRSSSRHASKRPSPPS